MRAIVTLSIEDLGEDVEAIQEMAAEQGMDDFDPEDPDHMHDLLRSLWEDSSTHFIHEFDPSIDSIEVTA